MLGITLSRGSFWQVTCFIALQDIADGAQYHATSSIICRQLDLRATRC